MLPRACAQAFLRGVALCLSAHGFKSSTKRLARREDGAAARLASTAAPGDAADDRGRLRNFWCR